MTDFNFYNMTNLRSDAVDGAQREIYNTRFSNHTVSNFHSDPAANGQVTFATQQPVVSWFSVFGGSAVGGGVIDVDSNLIIKNTQGRSLEKLSLNQRPFLTVPYLGRGSCDPLIEAQMLQGENIHEKKSVGTIMSKSFGEYTMFASDQKMASDATNPKYKIEESAMDGWIRGGILTREMMNDRDFTQQSRPASVKF
jgi:hypothetical protein